MTNIIMKSTLAQAPRPWPSRLAGRLAAAIRRWWQVRRDTADLMAADPALLRDLGITPSHVEDLVRFGRR